MKQHRKCPLCHHTATTAFSHQILKKYTIRYYHCSFCQAVFTEKPYWLAEAYRQPINIYDTGVLSRNMEFSAFSSVLIHYFFNPAASFLDYAGGYGIFTRLMRDNGFDFYTHDPMTENLFARGFEYPTPKPIELLTCFECFEHFSDPLKELEKMLKISKNILFSTIPLPTPLPDANWWYYSFPHGQHIFFYTIHTLEFIAQKYHLHFYDLGNLFLFTPKPINRLYLKILRRFTPLFFSLIKKHHPRLTFSDMESLVSSTSRQ